MEEMVLENSYWKRYQTMRTSRRRFLGTAGAAGVGVAGLALAGCGDDDDGKNDASILATPTAGANATPTPSDVFAGHKKGGTYRNYAAGDPPTIDPFGSTSFQTKAFVCASYSRLFRWKTGAPDGGGEVKPEGDLVQSYEISPDGLKWTLKLKAAKFHDIAPVSGRPVTTDDVKYSWGRFTDVKYGNSGNAKFVDKVEYPDASTLVFTLKAPNAGFREIFTDTTNLIIMPAEADGKFEATKQMIGSGPWIFQSYVPSQGAKYKRNPEWFDKGPQGFPLMDAVDYSIIPEYAAAMAQFRAGNLEALAPQAQDVVDLKKAIPNGSYTYYTSPQMNMFFFDNDPAAPWNKDPRVRQAISMSIDRDAVTELLYNLKKLQAGGIDVKGVWNNAVPAGMPRWWLDPQSKDQGDSAKFFKYDPAEAKKLLAAAGYADGFSAPFIYAVPNYGPTFATSAEAHDAFLKAVGVKTTAEPQDYTSKYFPQTWSLRNFKGIVYALETGFNDVGGYPTRWFTDNPLNHGFINDPELVKLTAQQQAESDEVKRKAILWDIQRKNAEKMHYIPSQWGAGSVWTALQPWVKNPKKVANNGYGGWTETAPYLWLDK